MGGPAGLADDGVADAASWLEKRPGASALSGMNENERPTQFPFSFAEA
jgi:hypothetical protein